MLAEKFFLLLEMLRSSGTYPRWKPAGDLDFAACPGQIA